MNIPPHSRHNPRHAVDQRCEIANVWLGVLLGSAGWEKNWRKNRERSSVTCLRGQGKKQLHCRRNPNGIQENSLPLNY